MKNQMYDLITLPSLVEEKKISLKEALDFITEEILRNPRAFCISNDQTEYLSDLYFKLTKNGTSLFSNFKKEEASFKTYLINQIQFHFKSIIRENCKTYEREKTIEQVQKTEYEEETEKYKQNEFEYKITHFTPYEYTKFDRAPYAQRAPMKKLPDCISSEKGQTDESLKPGQKLLFGRNTSGEKKTLLILSLKYGFYLSTENINTIANYCNINQNELSDTIKDLNQSLNCKMKRYENLKELRDFSYYQHRKCLAKLSELTKENAPTEEAKRLYDFHTEKWQNKNAFLNKKAYSICPTNKAIADVLGICDRQVGYYINRANKYLTEDFRLDAEDSGKR